MNSFLRLIIVAAMLLTQGCENGVEPETPSAISIEGEELLFDKTGTVIDRVLNNDNSYQTDVKLTFGAGSYILFTLNSENDRSFNSGLYIWSTESRNGAISAVSIFLADSNKQYELVANSFTVDSQNEIFNISFDLTGDLSVSGTFKGNLEFQERYARGSGSFEFDGTTYDIPYFALTDIIQNSDGYNLVRLYFYNFDPTNPFLKDQPRQFIYITIVQSSQQALQPGIYGSSESAVRPFTLFDGKPIIDTIYQFEGGSATISKTDSIYDVSFTLIVSAGNVNKTAVGTYSGQLNGW
jgi:hypothetical protein